MTALALESVLTRINNLPSLPVVVMELLATIDQADTNIDALARKITQDQALTAKTLRLANSSFYGMAHQVSTVAEAIAIVGFRTVRSLATTAALIGSLPDTTAGGFNFTPFWRHAIAAALCARELALLVQVNPEHAYTAGLLHDIGRLVLATQFPAQYEAVMAYRSTQDCTLLAAEQAVLALDHAAVGQALTQHWKFPLAMQQAVSCHHSPTASDVDALPLVILVAEALAHALDLSGDEDDLVPALARDIWTKLELDDTTLLDMLGRVEREFEGASLLLQA